MVEIEQVVGKVDLIIRGDNDNVEGSHTLGLFVRDMLSSGNKLLELDCKSRARGR